MAMCQTGAMFILICFIAGSEGIFNITPRTNIWVTWTNTAGMSDFCLSLQQVDNPFRTCLIGIPLQENETDFDGYWKQQRVDLTSSESETCLSPNGIYVWPTMRSAAWQKTVIENLNQSAHLPLQELDLLASVVPVEYVDVTATNMQDCNDTVPQLQPVNGTGVVWFDGPWYVWLARSGQQGLFIGCQNVTGHSPWNDLKTGGFTINTKGGFKLPPGVFLICGDRAWPGIPVRPVGSPCYLGQLTLFTLHMRELLNASRRHESRSRRSVRTFDDTCNDNVQLPSLATVIATSFFFPQ